MAGYSNAPEGLKERIEFCVRANFRGNWPELGRLAGVPPSTLKNLRRGGDPRGRTLLKLACALNVTVDWLLAGESLDHVGPRLPSESETDNDLPERRYAEANVDLAPTKDAGERSMSKPRGYTRRRPSSDARAKAWISMRVLQHFTLPQLQMTAGITEGNLFVFMRRLVRAGYLRIVKEREINCPGSRTVYQLVRNTGPLQPIPWNNGEVYDQNTREVFGQPKCESTPMPSPEPVTVGERFTTYQPEDHP